LRDPLADQRVEDVRSDAPILDQAGGAELRQVLREVRLAQSKVMFQVADARLPALLDRRQDAEPDGMT
jgi:hypothetical protein